MSLFLSVYGAPAPHTDRNRYIKPLGRWRSGALTLVSTGLMF